VLTSVDLFCGAGGLTEGLRAAGYSARLAVDFDQQAIDTFQHNHPGITAVCADITGLDGERTRELAKLEKGELDLLAGGPPCQGFSLAGQRLPDDPKNKLFLEFVGMARELEPRAILFENVAGIQSMQGGAVVAAIQASFQDLGYTVISGLLNAAEFGVPQARPRFILIGLRDGVPTLPSPTHRRANLDQAMLFESLLPAISVAEALSDLPRIEQGEGQEEWMHESQPLNDFQAERRGHRNRGVLYNHRATRHSELIVERYSLIPQGRTNAAVPEHLRTKKINVYRLSDGEPSRTVTCNFRTDLLHPWEPRGLTVREAARLQSFDDDYRFFGNLTRKAKYVTQDDQVGNAVPPLLAQALGRHIASLLDAAAPLQVTQVSA
jgi:DNA (cytosine-5)-methyltransferase 1